MKNSIKNLTIILVTFFFSNVSHAVTYTLSNGSWSGTGNPTLSNLTASDIVIITNTGSSTSSWTVNQNITVGEIRLTSGSNGSSTLNHTSGTITGNVTSTGNNSRIIGAGTSISGSVTISSGVLTVSNAKSASWTLSGGTLTNNAALTGAITVSGTATLNGTDATVGAVTISSGALTVSAAKTASSWTLNGGTLTNSANISGAITVAGTVTMSGTGSVGAVTLSSGALTVDATKTASSWTLNGGTLTNSANISGAITVAGAVTMSGNSSVGAVTLSSGTLTVNAAKTASSWTLNGGTLTNSSNISGAVGVSGTVTMSGSGTIAALNVSSGTLTLDSNKTSGILTLSGGTINLVSYTLTSSGNTSVSGNATIKSSGSGLFTNNSSRTTIGNSVTLIIDNAEYITDNLTFNATANDIETINGGIFSIDASGNTITGVSASHHINGTARYYYNGRNTRDTFTLPLGNGTVYLPVRFLFTGNDINNNALASISGNYGAHYVTVEYVRSKNNNTGIDNSTLGGGVSGTEYWNISTSSTNPTAKMIFMLNTGTLNSTTNIASDIEIAQYNTSTNKWTVLLASLGTVVNNQVPVITTANIAPNTAFTFGSVNSRTSFVTPLPVSLIDFSAKANDASIEVKWSTASEKDNADFVVEKSLDGQTWSAIGTVKGAKTSKVVNNYGLVDYKVVAGFQYYRLKQIDLDGTINYSKAIAFNFSKASTLNVNVFPNPAKGALNISTDNNATGEVNIQILNSMGETVYNQVLEAGLVQSIDITSFIPGVYYVSVIAEGESKIIRLLKN